MWGAAARQGIVHHRGRCSLGGARDSRLTRCGSGKGGRGAWRVATDEGSPRWAIKLLLCFSARLVSVVVMIHSVWLLFNAISWWIQLEGAIL